ncbi:MAG: hypothetical protein IPP94_12845 [Ignavibacteria bacterium]|nr:hypothetical protein [Ignavibacteria bacterium]
MSDVNTTENVRCASRRLADRTDVPAHARQAVHQQIARVVIAVSPASSVTPSEEEASHELGSPAPRRR